MAEQTTILAITHRPTFLEIADRIYRVDHPKVTEVGPMHGELSTGRVLALR